MFLTRRFYLLTAAVVLLLAGGHLLPPLFAVGRAALLLLSVAVLADAGRLYLGRKGVRAWRICPPRLSNGDDNEVRLRLESGYSFPVRLSVIDEIPAVFQRRDVDFCLSLRPGEGKEISYRLRPTVRGVYGFGRIRAFATTAIGLVERRFTCGEAQQVKVYPSFLMLRRYELLAVSDQLTETGIKRIRRVGHHTEFEQIKEYVKGDDYRTINWKASARRHQLMVNVYRDERSQQIYSVIDKGRVMQAAFRGMTLLDYAINASLVLSYVALRKEDKAGLVTWGERFDTFVPASRQSGQMHLLQETLYAQQTTFGETDFSALCVHLAARATGHSLLVLYTNFYNLAALQRCLLFLCQLARMHRLLVVFFEDSELQAYLATPPTDTEEYYRHVVARSLADEKRSIVSCLRQCGIASILTAPDRLSVDVVNKYLEMKARQAI